MAVSEARSSCQRMANRCVAQEDAKRASKLGCFPSSSSKQEPDQSNVNSANRTDLPASNFMVFKQKSMSFNLQPDTKWWLQQQPNSMFPANFTCEEPSFLEELDVKSTLTSELSGDAIALAATYADNEKKLSSSEAPHLVSSNLVKRETKGRNEDLNAVGNNFQQKIKQNTDLWENWYQNDLMDWKDVDQLISKKLEKDYFELETHWMGSEKSEPWWRAADKDELTSLVAKKSSQPIENCDLPRPQKVHFCRDPFGHLDCVDDNRSFALSSDQKLHARLDNINNSCSSGSIDKKHWTCDKEGHSVCGTEKTCSGVHAHNLYTKDLPENKHYLECDSSKAELLEALCHSQTRAREAEMAAQQAYNEKEHIVRLFFKQASYLFAYKQWIRMLQLESLILQLKVKERQISHFFPNLPWTPLKGIQLGREVPKSRKRKGPEHQRCDICRYAVAFAVGFSLASAGLLLGWSLGWLIPTF